MKTLDIQAKEWFDKRNGNSYFSAVCTLDFGLPSERVVYVPFQYGYGEHYLYEVYDTLTREGYIPKTWTNNRMKEFCAHYDIVLRYSKRENCLKKEVINHGSN